MAVSFSLTAWPYCMIFLGLLKLHVHVGFEKLQIAIPLPYETRLFQFFFLLTHPYAELHARHWLLQEYQYNIDITRSKYDAIRAVCITNMQW